MDVTLYSGQGTAHNGSLHLCRKLKLKTVETWPKFYAILACITLGYFIMKVLARNKMMLVLSLQIIDQIDYRF